MTLIALSGGSGPGATVGAGFIDLYWIPVGAGTRFQRASLVLFESIAAFLGRRRRARLLHAALKIGFAGEQFTLEVTPAPPGPNLGNEVTGPVGIRGADRLRLFRYQVCLRAGTSLPDERWAAGRLRVSDDAAAAEQVLDLAAAVPRYVWGRRRPGHPEMWTSDSCVAWLLGRAGIDVLRIELPAGTRAPGWSSGILEARGLGPASTVWP